MDDDLIGTAEAAAILAGTPHAIRDSRPGNIPHVRHNDGRVVLNRFRRAGILALVTAQEAGPPATAGAKWTA